MRLGLSRLRIAKDGGWPGLAAIGRLAGGLSALSGWRADGLDRIAGHLPVHQAPDPTRVVVAKLRGKRGLREVLVADRADEPLDGRGADRGGAGVGGGGVGPAVVDGVAGFDAGGEAVENEAADLRLQDRNQVAVFLKVVGPAVPGRGQLTF